MKDLLLLPLRFQDDFERTKADAELVYTTRTFAELLDDRHTPSRQWKLLRSVFFGYWAGARTACQLGSWKVAQTRQAMDAALPAIIDYYFEMYFRRDFERNTERPLSNEEERFHRGEMQAIVIASPQWKRYISELKALAEAATAKRIPKPDQAAGRLPPEKRRKGDSALLAGKDQVSFKTAEKYLGISARQRQNLTQSTALTVVGGGTNKKIITESLRKYRPPENPKQPEAKRSDPKSKPLIEE